MAGALADRDQADRQLREPAAAGERIGHALALLDRGGGLAERIAQRGVADRLAGDRQRVQDRHAVRQERAQGARQTRGVDPGQEAAEQRHAQQPAIDPRAALGALHLAPDQPPQAEASPTSSSHQ